MTDYLSAILARKRRENTRRRRHVAAMRSVERPPQPERSERALRALRRKLQTGLRTQLISKTHEN